jgi:hypothetical protein
MWITYFFSEPGQALVRNILESVSLVQAILHSYSSWRHSRARHEHGHEHEDEQEDEREGSERAGRGGVRVPRKGASAPGDTHAPLLSAVRRDPVPATRRDIYPANPHSDSAST